MPNPKPKRDTEQSEARDKTAKIVSGLVPGGASVYELFTALVKPLHERRFEDWVREVTMRLHRLETEGKINMEELSRNEEFNTIITKATLLAQQTHQKEKIEALRNMVVNFARELDAKVPNFDQVDYFLSFIDRINPYHILLLKKFRDPKNTADNRWYKIEYEVKEHIIDLFLTMYPELEGNASMLMQAWKDLYNFGFAEPESMKSVKYTKHSLKKMTTEFGDQFLELIEEKKL